MNNYQISKNILKLFYNLSIFSMIIILSASCNKELETQNMNENSPNLGHNNITQRSTRTINPFEVNNVISALTSLRRSTTLDPQRIYYYYKFNPMKITGDMLKIFERDTTLMILDYPFADPNLYYELNSIADETVLDSYKDGNLYIVFNSQSEVKQIFDNASVIDAVKLTELYLPDQNDEDLQIQVLLNSGFYNQNEIEELRLCLFKTPHGRVTYTDQFDGSTIAVPQIQVWALVFGIPVTTYTDDDGRYSIPYLFSAGTYIGTHAENWVAKIKPLNTTGGWGNTIINLAENFILGSIYWHGWRNSCQMKNDININFGVHSQPRYWAQLLHVLKLHYDYTSQDGIYHAPELLTIYAQWDQNDGSASAPLLGHLSTGGGSFVLNVLSNIFDTNLSTTNPNLFNLMTGLLPDVTFKRSEVQTNHYSERLSEMAFHEFAHSSLFIKVGQGFWLKVIYNIIAASGSTCDGYGCGDETYAGYTQVNEAWAEFIGVEYHKRFHPNGRDFVILSSGIRSWVTCPVAQEDVAYFTNTWINTGIFYDLMDSGSIFEQQDNLSNYTISNMYNCFSPNTNGFCDWRDVFMIQNPSVGLNVINDLMITTNLWPGTCY